VLHFESSVLPVRKVRPWVRLVVALTFGVVGKGTRESIDLSAGIERGLRLQVL
jgi:hypothetical protein